VKYFEFTKKWLVKVPDEESEEAAKKLIAADPDKYLKSETVIRTEYRQKPQQQQSGNGWVRAAKAQLLG
jgi:hypothetical protein